MNLISIILFLLVIGISSISANSRNLYYGKKALANKNYSLAIQYFKKEISRFPKRCEGYYYLGLTFEKMKQKELSIKQYEHVTKTYCPKNLKEQAFWKVLHYYRFKEDWENLYLVAKSFLKLKPSRSIEKYVKLAESQYDPQKIKVLELLQEAQSLEKEKKYIMAAEKYKKIFSIQQDVEFLLKSASLYKQSGKNQKALEVFFRILKYQPDQWYANYQVGIYYYYSGYPEKSIPYLQKAEKYHQDFDPNFIYYINLAKGFSYLNMEDFSNVEKCLKRLESLEVKKEEKFYVLKNIYMAIRKWEINSPFLFQKLQNPDYKKIHPESITIYRMVQSFYSQDYEKLYKIFVESSWNGDRWIRWANYIKQFYAILLLVYRDHSEQINTLLDLSLQKPISQILRRTDYGYFLTLFLGHYAGWIPRQNQLDQYYYNLLFSDLNWDTVKLIFLYSTFRSHRNHLFMKYFPQEPSQIKEKHLQAFLLYLYSLILLKQDHLESAYRYLFECIQLDPSFKNIAKEEKQIQILMDQNQKWKELIKEDSIFDFLS